MKWSHVSVFVLYPELRHLRQRGAWVSSSMNLIPSSAGVSELRWSWRPPPLNMACWISQPAADLHMGHIHARDSVCKWEDSHASQTFSIPQCQLHSMQHADTESDMRCGTERVWLVRLVGGREGRNILSTLVVLFLKFCSSCDYSSNAHSRDIKSSKPPHPLHPQGLLRDVCCRPVQKWPFWKIVLEILDTVSEPLFLRFVEFLTSPT